MSNIDTYLASLPQDMRVSDVSARMLFGAGGTSLEAAMPVAQAPERKRMWGGDTRTFQQYDPSNPKAKRQITGLGEGVASVGSGFAAAPAAGWAGMGELVRTGDPQAASRKVAETAERLTYEPRTEEGRTVANVVNKPLEWYNKAAEGMGEAGEEYYGVPRELTTGFLQAAPVALGGLKTAFPKEYAMGMNKLAQGTVSPMMETFAGVKAKNAPLGMLEKAKQMAAEGIPDKQIWSETGWTKGFADKQWRFEIPDNEMKAIYNADEIYRPREYYQKEARRLSEAQDALANDFKQGKISKESATVEFRRLKGLQDATEQKANEYYTHGAGTATRMGEEIPFEQAFRHDQLKQAYGDLPTVSFTDRLPFEGSGSYSQGRIQTSLLNDPAEATMAHELQHAVQEREGFARGGNPSEFDPVDILTGKETEIRRAALNFLSDNYSKAELDALYKKSPYEMMSTIDNMGKYSSTPFTPKELAKLEYLSKDAGFKSFDDMLVYAKEADLFRSSEGQYRSLAGEAEARLTANRMNLTPEQRRAQYPVSEFDVPVEQQIVRGVPGAVEQAYAKMRDPKSKAMLERQYPELKERSVNEYAAKILKDGNNGVNMTPKELAELSKGDDLSRLIDKIESAHDYNNNLDVQKVREWFGDKQADEFASWNRRKKDNWLENNLLVSQDAELQKLYINTDLMEEYRSAALDFDTESPTALGRSIAKNIATEIRTKGAIDPDSPIGVMGQNAFDYAKQQGWDTQSISNAVRNRLVELYGNDAIELAPQFFEKRILN